MEIEKKRKINYKAAFGVWLDGNGGNPVSCDATHGIFMCWNNIHSQTRLLSSWPYLTVGIVFWDVGSGIDRRFRSKERRQRVEFYFVCMYAEGCDPVWWRQKFPCVFWKFGGFCFKTTSFWWDKSSQWKWWDLKFETKLICGFRS